MRRLTDEIRRAEFKTLSLKLGTFVTGDKDYRHFGQGRVTLEGLADLEAAVFRHVYIQQHQVRRRFTRQFECVPAGGCEAKRREIAQDAIQYANHHEVVVDQKNAEILFCLHTVSES